MSVNERILKAYEKHGPMSAKQLRKHVDVVYASVATAQLARKGKLIKLSGGPKSSIYGLPGQTAPAAAADETPAKTKRAYKRRAPGTKKEAAPAHKKRRSALKKRSTPLRKSQRNTALSAKLPLLVHKASKLHAAGALLRTPHAVATAGVFRAAIASDGAMIFLGAEAGPFELTREETRVAVAFVRQLDAATVTAA